MTPIRLRTNPTDVVKMLGDAGRRPGHCRFVRTTVAARVLRNTTRKWRRGRRTPVGHRARAAAARDTSRADRNRQGRLGRDGGTHGKRRRSARRAASPPGSLPRPGKRGRLSGRHARQGASCQLRLRPPQAAARRARRQRLGARSGAPLAPRRARPTPPSGQPRPNRPPPSFRNSRSVVPRRVAEHQRNRRKLGRPSRKLVPDWYRSQRTQLDPIGRKRGPVVT